MLAPSIGGLQQTTNYKVVLPFYVYAAISFFIGTILLLLNTDIINVHYFNPHTLAITHVMALGWGTMIVLGASHQLLPVLVEGKLDSNLLAYLSFIFTAIGIPILLVGFYTFQLGSSTQFGGILINIGVICYLVNVLASSLKSNRRNVHAWYMITAVLWLFSAVFFGLLLLINFSKPILSKDSVHYLALHAHLGIIGWFLLMVIGVGTRLIPMFLISKYTNDKILWLIYGLINTGLISFVFMLIYQTSAVYFYLPIFLIMTAIILFGRHCYLAYKVRIRKNVDEQMKTSLLSVAQMILPIVTLILLLAILPVDIFPNMAILYGFCIFFGWLTAIIIGMTFKTLPFIIWNKVYHTKAYTGKTPAPKELFSEQIYNIMLYAYLAGFILFCVGIIILNTIVLKLGAIALVVSAVLYVVNIGKALSHKPKIS